MAHEQYYKLRYRIKNSGDNWTETERMRKRECFNLEVLAHDTEYEFEVKRHHSRAQDWGENWLPCIIIRTPKRFLTDGYLDD